MTRFQKISGLVKFYLQIIVSDSHSNANLLDVDRLLLLALLFKLFCFLVLVLSPVNNTGNGRVRVRRYLYEVYSG